MTPALTNGQACRKRQASRRRDDSGQTILWAVGLCLLLLGLGGLVLDTWRAFSAWRSLAATADAAASAGASGIDEATFRASGGATIVLDPVAARRRAEANLAAQTDDRQITTYEVDVADDQVTVTVHGQLDLALLRLAPGDNGIDMAVTATADPRPSS